MTEPDWSMVMEQIRAIRADQAELRANDAELAALLADIQGRMAEIAELLKRQAPNEGLLKMREEDRLRRRRSDQSIPPIPSDDP